VGTSNATHVAYLHSKLWSLQINMAESLSDLPHGIY